MKSRILIFFAALVCVGSGYLPARSFGQANGPRVSQLGIRDSTVSAIGIAGMRRRDSASTRFSSTKGAVVGAFVGAAVGAGIVVWKGDYSSCASDIGPFYCRLGQVAFVFGGAAIGALVGFLLGSH